MNMTKYQDAYQEKDLIFTFNHLVILMYRFVRKILLFQISIWQPTG